MKNNEKDGINESEIKNAMGHIKAPQKWKEKAVNGASEDYEPAPYVKWSFRRITAVLCSAVLVLGIVIACYTVISRSMLKDENITGSSGSTGEETECEKGSEEEAETCGDPETETDSGVFTEEPPLEEPVEDTCEYTEMTFSEKVLCDEHTYFVTPGTTVCRRPGYEDFVYPGDSGYVTVLNLKQPGDWTVSYEHDAKEFGVCGYEFSDIYGHRFIVSDLIYYPGGIDCEEIFDTNVILRLGAVNDRNVPDNGTVLISVPLNCSDDEKEEVTGILGECLPVLVHGIASFENIEYDERLAGAYMYLRYLEAREVFYSFHVHAGSMYGFDVSSIRDADFYGEQEPVYTPKAEDTEIVEELEIYAEDESPYNLYFPVTMKNGAISSYTGWKSYLETLFTHEIVDMLLEEGTYKGDDSTLYARMADRGTDITYGNIIEYQAVMTDENTVDFAVVVEHGDLWNENPMMEYECFHYEYVRTEEGWRWGIFSIYN